MAAPKLSPSQLAALYKDKGQNQNLHDKQIIESLLKRLNEKIQKDPKLAQKAALIIESWMKIKPKP